MAYVVDDNYRHGYYVMQMVTDLKNLVDPFSEDDDEDAAAVIAVAVDDDYVRLYNKAFYVFFKDSKEVNLFPHCAQLVIAGLHGLRLFC